MEAANEEGGPRKGPWARLRQRRSEGKTKKRSKLRVAAWVFLALTSLLVLVLYMHNVSVVPTTADRKYAKLLLAEYNVLPPKEQSDFNEELRFIRDVQRIVLTHAPGWKGIPLSQEREVQNLYNLKHGLCFDRSRAIEMILAVYGFEVRHVSVFAKVGGDGRLGTLLKSGPSHALSEVKTTKGWLTLDSNYMWSAVTSDLKPVSIEGLQRGYGTFQWQESEVEPEKILQSDFVRVYGLYSRHGRFYPPFNFIPDIAWSTFLDNIF